MAILGLIFSLAFGLSQANADEQPSAAIMEASTIPAATPAVNGKKPAKFAILAFRPQPETIARWQPLIDYLNNANLGRRLELVALGQKDLEAAIREKQVDFVLTQPAHYILLAQREGLLSPLATLIEKLGDKPLPSISGVIAARSDQKDIQSLADLAGKRIAVSSKAELGGYMAQAYEMMQRGIQLPDDARILETGPPQDQAIAELLAGHADAAFVRTGLDTSRR